VTVRVRDLTAADIPAAMRIKEAAGWNQTVDDWSVLLRLAPETCFGVECEGALAATTTAVCYERRLAWIGMVLTDPAHRRRGLGRALMEHAIEALMARQTEWIKLDATEMGTPLYRQLGFEDEGLVERWRAVAPGGVAGTYAGGWPAGCGDLDRTVFGADRLRLLDALAPWGVAAVAGEGYAMARPGSEAAYFGPCVCGSAETARELLGWFLSRHAGEPVYWDLLPENGDAVRLAREFGFEPVRRLVRMVRRGVGGAVPLTHDALQAFAIAGFEYG